MTVISIPPPIKKYVKINTSDASERLFFINWIRFVLFFLFFALIFVILLMLVLMIHKEREKPISVHDVWPALSQLEEKIIEAIKHHLSAKNDTVSPMHVTNGSDEHTNANTTNTETPSKPSNNSSYHIVGWIEDFMHYYHRHVTHNQTHNETDFGKESNSSRPHVSLISITDTVLRVQPLKGDI